MSLRWENHGAARKNGAVGEHAVTKQRKSRHSCLTFFLRAQRRTLGKRAPRAQVERSHSHKDARLGAVVAPPQLGFLTSGKFALIADTLSTPPILQMGCEKSLGTLGTGTSPW